MMENEVTAASAIKAFHETFGQLCPLLPETCDEMKLLRKRIVELERQVVMMQWHDNTITQSRVFEIKFSSLLDPMEAMQIFFDNVVQAFGRSENNGN